MRENNKDKFITILILLGVISNLVVFNVISTFFYRYDDFRPDLGEVLKVARTTNPITMDPCDSWDSASNDMLNQVVETLIAYDLSDPNFPFIGRLAESWYWIDNTTITFQLRENVNFHDGSKFTADCVLHTFTRINYFGNWSGKLPSTKSMAFPHSLYKFDDGTPIFNDTLSFKTDDYNVSLVLNRPFGPIEGLLAYTASSIVHSDSTPVDELLDISTDMVVGTGPFKLISYVPNSEVRFVRWEGYWLNNTYWDQIVYVYYRDANTANNAMLAGDIDFLGEGINSLKPTFEVMSDVTVTGNGTSEYIIGPIYYYIGFNSEILNYTWRKTISYAFNYTYLIKDIKEDMVIKANSLVPPSFPAYNSSVVGGVYNIPYARSIMQSMGFGHTNGTLWDIGSQNGDDFIPGTDEFLWKAAEFIPVGTDGNFTDNCLNVFERECDNFIQLLLDRFISDLDLIGINIKVQHYCIEEWPIPLPASEIFHIYYYKWAPDYLETFKMIHRLVNPSSPYNWARINNTEINSILNLVMTESETLQRYNYYEKLQYLIHDKYYYHMPLFYDKIYYVHATSLKGVPYNSLRSLYWYPTYRE